MSEKSCSNCLLESHCKYYGKTLTWLLGDKNEQTGEKVCKSWKPNQPFDPELEMQKVKEELNELIDTTEGKDKEMYQEILELANGFDDE